MAGHNNGATREPEEPTHLLPGALSVQVSGANNTRGVALVEVCALP